MSLQNTARHLSILGIIYIIIGGIYGLFSLIFLFSLFLEQEKIMHQFPDYLPELNIIFVTFFIIGIIVGLAMSLCMILSGIGLLKHKFRLLIYVVAAFLLLSLPLGTILGIFTLVVMSREESSALFRKTKEDDEYSEEMMEGDEMIVQS